MCCELLFVYEPKEEITQLGADKCRGYGYGYGYKFMYPYPYPWQNPRKTRHVH